MNTLPADYEERVYAGVLGKIIGVYLGRPFEGWWNKKIEEELGEINYYVHEKLNKPLIVTDDDISGTFTFLRALPDHGNTHALTAAQIGRTWLNYLIDKRTVLWWGGMGMSTEHTAFLRLKNGIEAPASGSIETNGKVVAEQIGSQIFIDGWAMVCPGDPEKAVALARKAASVSHDGEAIYGAQILAAMEAHAFVEPSLSVLLDTAQTFIPRDSIIYALIQDLRAWREAEPRDWRATFRKIEDKYGYDTYGGNCHMVPNHAVILLALLYGDDDFQRSLMIANTAGWDTDCNSGNVGCLMGIKNGLAGIDKGPDWRSPVADRMYLPTADGGRAVTDALRETYQIVNIARALQGQRPVAPKHGMRFHFSLPGSVQGFQCEDSIECRETVQIENVDKSDTSDDAGGRAGRMLALRYRHIAPGRAARIATATFTPPDAMKMAGYSLIASPTLYPGQIVRARLVADDRNERAAAITVFVSVYGKNDTLEVVRGESRRLSAGESHNFHWTVPDTGGSPIAQVGIEIGGSSGQGTVFLDWLNWGGVPDTILGQPTEPGEAWRRAWVNAADDFSAGKLWEGNTYKIIQNEGTGQALQGEWFWCDYIISVEAYPHLAESIGLIVNARGLRRHVALTLSRDGKARLIENSDGVESVLDEGPIDWKLDHKYGLSLTAGRDGILVATIQDGDEEMALSGFIDPSRASGAIGLLAREGHCQFGAVRIKPLAEV